MGYLDGLTAASFKTDKHGDVVFYPWGIWGRGRVLSTAKAAQVRKFVRRYYLATFAIGFVILATYFSRVPAFHSRAIPFMVLLPWMLIGWYGLRKLLAGSPYSDERLSRKEALRNSAAGHGRLSLSLLVLASVLNVALGIWVAVRGYSAHHVMGGVVWALAFGACAALFGFMLKVRTPTNNGAEVSDRRTSRIAIFIVLLVLAVGYLALQEARERMLYADMVAPSNVGNFSYAEWSGFLAAARKAETIADREQRCLAYPDPPGSHWPHVFVATYCHFLFQPTMSRDEVKDLIAQGRFSELDHLEADKLAAERSEPEARGQFDVNFDIDFYSDSADLRAKIDLWVVRDPGSAFAHAASGASYIAMAETARGDDIEENMPKVRLDAMKAMLEKARTELRRALAIDSRITYAYAAMMEAYGLQGDRADVESVSLQGLGVDPANFAIYGQLLWGSQPRWGGSLDAMQKIEARMRQHLTDNPLLSVLLPETATVEANIDCACRKPVRFDQYRKIFDQLPNNHLLASAGRAAERAQKYPLAVVYLSEALRFRPVFIDERISRATALAELGQLDWARADADSAIAARPKSSYGYYARAHIHQLQGDPHAAAQDFEQSLTLAPDNYWTQWELGYLYSHDLPEWDKAWALANRMIQRYPDQPGGWELRACVQMDQPRPGLRETAQYVVDHFGEGPGEARNVAFLRSVLAKLDRKAKAADVGH